MSFLGAFCGLLVQAVGGWIVPAGLLAVAAILTVKDSAPRPHPEERHGITTEIAALVMYMIGAAVVLVQTEIAVVACGIVAVLLHWKQPLHAFAQRMDEAEIRSVIRFTLIGLVVLPVLPDRPLDPLGVLNPFEIWLMVVLIVGISLLGYLGQKFLSARGGTLLAGVLGGLVSSTATAVAYARHSGAGRAAVSSASLVVLIASVIVFPRVLFEIGIVAPAILPSIAPPLVGMTMWMALVAVVFSIQSRAEQKYDVRLGDPSNLEAAVAFGVLYAVVLLAVALAKKYFGDSGLYVVAILSGLTDMDAITLSTAQMIRAQHIEVDIGWRMILIGAISNLVLKGLAVAILGHRTLARRIALMFCVCLAGGVAILWFWPSSS